MNARAARRFRCGACSTAPARASRESGRGRNASDFIFFIDDDALAEPDWAAELLDDSGAATSTPRVAWLSRNGRRRRRSGLGRACRSARSSRPAHDRVGAGVVAERFDNYFSANVGFKRSAFARFGKFGEDLGVVGGNPISGEDTELFARIVTRGGAMGFAPRAIVHHLIPPERMTLAYLRRKSFAFGMGTAFARLENHNRLDKLVRYGVRMAAAAIRQAILSAQFLATEMRQLSRLLARTPAREIAPRRRDHST